MQVFPSDPLGLSRSAATVRTGLMKAFALTTVIVLVGLFAVGFPALLFAGAMLGGALVWGFTTLRTPIDPAKIIGPYLITVALFIIHIAEEYLGNMERVLSALSGHEISQSSFLLLAAFFAPVFWLSGAVLMLHRSQLGEFIASVFLFGMVVGETSHFAFPFLEDGTFHYSAGMVTAVLLIGSGIITIMKVRREVRALRTEEIVACVD